MKLPISSTTPRERRSRHSRMRSAEEHRRSMGCPSHWKAWAEFLHDKIKRRALYSQPTYHELTKLAEERSGVLPISTSRCVSGMIQIIFFPAQDRARWRGTRVMEIPSGTPSAGLPKEILDRAKDIFRNSRILRRPMAPLAQPGKNEKSKDRPSNMKT